MEKSINNPTKEQYLDKRSRKIDNLAHLIMNRDDGELGVMHIDLLYGMTTQSLLDCGLVGRGKIHEVYDTGETQQVSELMQTHREASDFALDSLGVDEQGDWGAKFSDESELIVFLTETSDNFEQLLIQAIKGE